MLILKPIQLLYPLNFFAGDRSVTFVKCLYASMFEMAVTNTVLYQVGDFVS